MCSFTKKLNSHVISQNIVPLFSTVCRSLGVGGEKAKPESQTEEWWILPTCVCGQNHIHTIILIDPAVIRFKGIYRKKLGVIFLEVLPTDAHTRHKYSTYRTTVRIFSRLHCTHWLCVCWVPCMSCMILSWAAWWLAFHRRALFEHLINSCHLELILWSSSLFFVCPLIHLHTAAWICITHMEYILFFFIMVRLSCLLKACWVRSFVRGTPGLEKSMH